jgi:arsenite methyltransferase
MTVELNVDEAVRQRYAEGARERQESLCCPVSYEPRYLEVIPGEVVARDQG